jgi:hypothetical protein
MMTKCKLAGLAMAASIMHGMNSHAASEPATATATSVPSAVPSSDPLMNALIRKGILTQEEAAQVRSEMTSSASNEVQKLPASKWKISEGVKSIGLYGDARLRYEYRRADNPLVLGPNNYDQSPRDRFRYSLRFGIKGELYDQFSYGMRLETGPNPRSPWLTFGDSSNGSTTPSSKGGASIYLGQMFVKWQPEKWAELTVGKMPMPLYTTPMVWDPDICPEGFFEKFNVDIGPANVFASFGQFVYENPAANPALTFYASDVFLTAWQIGATVNIDKDVSLKVAPVFYTYTGLGSTNGVFGLVGQYPYTGQSDPTGGVPNLTSNGGIPITGSQYYNQSGINDLLILEIPAELNFKILGTPLGPLHGRFFGDFSLNLQGNRRSLHAFQSAGGVIKRNFTDEFKAYQFGFGIGDEGPVYGPTQGLVYGSTSKKKTWESRVYWQHVEQYALDVNLLDSDYFEGRANLEGIFAAFSYSFTDSMIGTLRYGYARRINKSLGTGGSNNDLPLINPIDGYRIAQIDLTMRF